MKEEDNKRVQKKGTRERLIYSRYGPGRYTVLFIAKNVVLDKETNIMILKNLGDAGIRPLPY